MIAPRWLLRTLPIVALLAACEREAPKASSSAPSPATSVPAVQEVDHPAPPEKVVRLYGKALGEVPTVDLGALLEAPEAHAGKNVLVEGIVHRACTRKGCWVELAATRSEDAKRCRVTFKDYTFFVPTDSAGASARLEGIVEVTTVEKAMVDHLEEEGARFASKESSGEAREVRIVASGIELWNGEGS